MSVHLLVFGVVEIWVQGSRLRVEVGPGRRSQPVGLCLGLGFEV